MSTDQIQDRLDEIGQSLRQRPRLAGQALAQIVELPPEPPLDLSLRSRPRRALRLWLAGGACALTVAVAIAVVMWPSNTNVTWAQVTAATRAQPWIRGQAVFPGRKTRAEIWMSHEHQMWALKIDRTVRFISGSEQAIYAYNGGKTLTKYPSTDEWQRQQSSYDAMARSADSLGPWLFHNEAISQQGRREVMVEGKMWIEYDLVINQSKRVLRIDPRTRLPVFMRIDSRRPDDAVIEYVFDYPTEGPRDPYALGVPRDARLIDLMPGPEVARMVAGLAASRRSIGDFKMYVARDGNLEVVWRKGDRWRIDSFLTAWSFDPSAQPALGNGRDEWWQQQAARYKPSSSVVSDGKIVAQRVIKLDKWQLANSRAPSDLLSPIGGAIGGGVCFVGQSFPDLRPEPDYDFEFVGHPTDGPAGTVLWKYSSGLTDGSRGHRWCYLDPDQGYSVVRSVNFDSTLNDKAASPDTSSRLFERSHHAFVHTPQGWWYPTTIIELSTTIDPATGERKLERPAVTTTYHFDFHAEIPDSLFVVDPPVLQME